MTEILACPSCRKQLQIPDNYFGQLVQCPQCQHQFEAQPMPSASPSPRGERVSEPDNRGHEWNEGERGDAIDDDLPIRRRRAYLPPHRGGLVLTFGILSICCVASVITGTLAWVFANTDLRAMDEGRMDPSGREQTQTGKTLGIIGLSLNVLVIGGYCLFVILIGMTGMFDGPRRRR